MLSNSRWCTASCLLFTQFSNLVKQSERAPLFRQFRCFGFSERKSARVQEKGARKEGPEGWRQEVWSILWWEPDTSRFSFSRRKSNRFFDDLRKGFPVYLDPKNQNTFVFSRDSGGPSRSSVCLNLESVQHSLERHLRRRDA